MNENKRFTTKEIDNFSCGIKVSDIIMDKGVLLTQSTVCDLLNKLIDENEQLKNILKDITIQLDANHTMNTYHMVIPINRFIYNELNRRLKETSFNEELRRFLE